MEKWYKSIFDPGNNLSRSHLWKRRFKIDPWLSIFGNDFEEESISKRAFSKRCKPMIATFGSLVLSPKTSNILEEARPFPEHAVGMVGGR